MSVSISTLEMKIKLLDIAKSYLPPSYELKNIGQDTYRVEPCPVCGHKDHFTIYDDSDSYSSFSGCCQGGKAYKFLQEVLKMDKAEAYNTLEKLADVTRNDEPLKKDYTNYIKRVFNEQKDEDKQYFFNRGLSKGVINKHKLCIKKENDRLWAFLPYWENGKVHYYTRRALNNQKPRYKNTPGKAPIFNEGNISNAKEGDIVIICEGIFDALSFEEIGLKAAALGGTEHLNKALDIISEKEGVYFLTAFDNDEAGVKTTEKAKQFGLIPLPILEKYKDANEWLVADKEGFKQAIYREVEDIKKEKPPYEYRRQQTQLTQANNTDNITQKGDKDKENKPIKQQIETINQDQSTADIIEQLKPIFKQLKGFSELEKEAYLLDIKKRFGFTGDMIKTIKKNYFYTDTDTDTDTVIVEEIEPYGEAVSGLELADEIESILKRHSFMNEYNYTAVTLWTMLTYAYNTFGILPKLLITSPTKRCGKTTLLTTIEGLVYKSIIASNISPAAFYRLIDKYNPTILIDEADTGFSQNDDLKGIVNAGHTKRTAFVVRTSDKTKGFEPERFNVFVPQVIAMIGKPLGTLLDRSIVIETERKPTVVKLEKLSQQYYEDNKEIRQKLLKWADDSAAVLVDIKVDIPEIGNDRAIDNWLPLFSIAQLIGGDWPQKVNKAMLEIESQNEDADLRTELLKDIKEYFEARANNKNILDSDKTKVLTKELIEYLNNLDDKPYADFSRGKGITPARLSKLLKDFKIKPKTIRMMYDRKKGYELTQFTKAFNIYIYPETKRDIVTMATEQRLQENKSVTDNKVVTFSDSEKTATEQECHDVTDTEGDNIEINENNNTAVF